MELYLHRTSGGAEYYSTTFTQCPDGHKEGTLNGTCLRTDGDELELFSFEQLRLAGFKSVVLPDGERVEL